MSDLIIHSKLWHRIADVIQDMGSNHPQLSGTQAGADLYVLSRVIKYGIPSQPDGQLDPRAKQWMQQAESIIRKHGVVRAGTPIVEQAIDTVERLLGQWVQA